MNRLLPLLLVGCLGAQFAQAQYCDNVPPGQSLNFDWQANGWTVWVRPNATLVPTQVYVPSPFVGGSNNLQPNTSHLLPNAGVPQNTSSDGWELVAEFMGFNPQLPTRFPQFILYNRYESKLRYFAYLTDVSSVDEVQVEVKFTTGTTDISHVSAALEHAFTPMDVVEGYTNKNILISVPNEFYNQSGVWCMADIPVAYVPCTCEYGSRLQFNSASIDYATFNFTLTGGGDIVQVINTGVVTNQRNRFSNVTGKINTGLSKGNSAFKTTTEFVGVVEKLLVSQANRRLTQDIRDNLAAGGLTGGDLTVSDVRSLWNLQQSGNTNPPLLTAVEELFPKKVSSVIPEWLRNTVPFANTAVALLDFVIGGGKASPPQPMHFQANFEFSGSGTITNSSPEAGMAVNVPGSKQTVPTVFDPGYNEVMGILNLMETPVLKVAVENESTPFGALSKYSMLLEAPLRYAFNPASGLVLEDIVGALYFYGCAAESPDPSLPDPGLALGLIEDEPGIWRTPYMPLSCFSAYTMYFLGVAPTIALPPTWPYLAQCNGEIQLHLMAKLKSPAGQTSWAARYPVTAQQAAYTYGDTPQNPYLTVPESITVTDIDQVINNNLVAWSEITVQNPANLDDPIVRAFVTGKDDPPFVLEETPANPTTGAAGFVSQIPFDPRQGGIIPGPFTITNPPDCGELLPVDLAWLTSFCQNPSRYNPLLSRSGFDDGDDSSTGGYQLPESTLKLWPNPATEWATIVFDSHTGGQVSIRIVDAWGRVVAPERQVYLLPETAWQTEWQVSTWPSGVYVAIVDTPVGRRQLRLVKQ